MQPPTLGGVALMLRSYLQVVGHVQCLLHAIYIMILCSRFAQRNRPELAAKADTSQKNLGCSNVHGDIHAVDDRDNGYR